MLISSMVGMDLRTTMDMDATIKGFSLTEENLQKILQEIVEQDVYDETKFTLGKIDPIRDDDDYTGYRVSINAEYGKVQAPIKLDITTGDRISPKEVKYKFDLMFEDRKIEILAYNLETVLAEKFETIIVRNIENTRARDFYDIYILWKFQIKNIDKELFKQAINEKFNSRGTEKHLQNLKEIFTSIKSNEKLIGFWNSYRKNYAYAEEITYNDVMEVLKNIISSLTI
ncbi:MAG: nucleotidyl transferase AbiEii/AbiGii toxin family protein [Clostridia bacterium]